MTRDTEADVAFIRALAEILHESDLVEIEVEREYGEDDELKVRLSRAAPAQHAPAMHAPAYMTAHPAPMAPAPVAAPVAAAPVETAADGAGVLTSPMVGTAYLSSEPGAAPFVQVGDAVSEGQTVLIIEAMKTMNQIPAPRAGRVAKILVANAEPVEFGAPLLVLE